MKLRKNQIPEHLLKFFKPTHQSWILRNDCVWAKRNGMPESVTDRFSKKHEYIFFFVKSQKYYFDLNAIRDKHKTVSLERMQRGISENNKWIDGDEGQTPHGLHKPRTNIKFGGKKGDGNDNGIYSGNEWAPREDGKNPGDVSDFWDIVTKGSSDSHYASYNEKLLIKPILAGCPENGLILDPFAGTNTTGITARKLNRNFIGFELSNKYHSDSEIKTSNILGMFK